MAEYKIVDAKQLETDLTSVADTIRSKGGTSDALAWPEGFIAAIEDIETEGGSYIPIEEKDVSFYDYDGTLLYSYSLEEAQALTELPPAPTPKKDFLEFVEWNWTLDQIKEVNLPVDVGATYKTTDGKTHAVIEVTDPLKMEVTLNYCQWCSSIKVNWGDGTEENETTTSGGKNVTLTHTYQNTGTYTITVGANGTWNVGLNGATGPFIGVGNNDYLSNGFLKEIYIGTGARLLSYAFLRAFNLETITIPKTIVSTWVSPVPHCYRLRALMFPSTMTTIATSYANYCYGLRVVSLPYSITSVSSDAFGGTSMKTITIPPNVTTFSLGSAKIEKVWLAEGVQAVGSKAFYTNYAVSNIELPSSVTSIAAQSFYNCWSLMRLCFRSETPPTVANANAFTGIPATCIVEVPSGCLAAYQEATNYSGIAAQMVEQSK
jgi:hypothetical protein